MFNFTFRDCFFIAEETERILTPQKKKQKRGPNVWLAFFPIPNRYSYILQTTEYIHVKNCQRVLWDIGFPRFNISDRLYFFSHSWKAESRIIVWDLALSDLRLSDEKWEAYEKAFRRRLVHDPTLFYPVNFFMQAHYYEQKINIYLSVFFTQLYLLDYKS